MRKFVAFGPALVVLITTLVTLVAAPAAVRMVGYAETDASVTLARQTIASDDILDRINKQVRAIAESVSPSVVYIRTVERGRGGFARVGQGSGWVYDAQGHIVTNAHVVRGADKIVVQFQDGRQVDAELIGRDSSTDVAVIRAKTEEGLLPARRANGRMLHQGDRVYAFGSPFGFKFSMSEGIVSGLGRDPRMVIGQGGYTNFIQTDAAVNPGNSGGPLVDIAGEVVGMNVAIATASNTDGTSEGQSSGISFAIPLETIDFVVGQLIERGVVVKGFLGISHPGDDDRNTALLEQLRYRGRGVVVTEVVNGAPADKAGLRVNDVILEFNGVPIWSVPGLRSAISNTPPGKQTDVKVSRDGEIVTLSPTLSNLPPTPVDLREVLAALQRFGIDDLAETSAGEIVITRIMARSSAARAGFRAGQIIREVDGQSVNSLENLLNQLARAGLSQGRTATLVTTDAEGENRQSLKIEGR